MKKRVVITGLGAVTPIGIGKNEFWNNLIAGKSGVGPITQFDTTDFDVRIAGEVKNFDYTQFIDKKEGKRMDRVTQFAVAAAKLAVEDAKLDHATIDPCRAGVCVGSGIGGIHTFLEQSIKYAEKGPSKISPFFIPMQIPNMPAGQISIALGFKGPNTAIITACATGTNCIGDALRTIQYGDADLMIAGGTEAAISPIAVAGFGNMKALSTNNENPEKASCPFDKKRDGFVMGEGAGVVLLEELEHAKKRGAHIYAEVLGFGMNADAYHITAPDPSGEMPAACMQLALDDAGVKPEEVDYINAHGTSTHRNDLNETVATKKVFGEHAYKMTISSNKSMTGHLLGAAGGVEAIATVLTIENSIIPPTINYEDQDLEEGLDLDYVPNVARQAEVNVAISNNFGFGGHNATILFKKYKD
ncbi:MAG: beta-ketoacyl-ACP synthase II [Acidaminococcaceae bacterium]